MKAGLALVISGSIVLGSGCTFGRGTPPYRQDLLPVHGVEDYEEPGGVISLEAAPSSRIDCPHCGASNRLGESECKACGKRLSSRPVWVPCPACQGPGAAGKPAEPGCPRCAGRGWVASAEESGAPGPLDVPGAPEGRKP